MNMRQRQSQMARPSKPLLITQLPSNMASSPELFFLMLLSRWDLWLPRPQHPHRKDTRNPEHENVLCLAQVSNAGCYVHRYLAL